MRKGCSRSRTFAESGSTGCVPIEASSPVRTLSSNDPNRTRSTRLVDSLFIRHSYVGSKLPCLITSHTPVQLIHRQIDNENNRKIMPKCIYLRNRKESKSGQRGPREGRRSAVTVASM